MARRRRRGRSAGQTATALRIGPRLDRAACERVAGALTGSARLRRRPLSALALTRSSRAAGRMTTMQQCRVRGVRSVELMVTNLEEAGRFYESVWALRPVKARDGVRLYRGTAAYHHIVGLHRGPRPGLVRIVFDVADRDGVDALHHAISTAGGPVTAPARLPPRGGGHRLRCPGPGRGQIALVWAPAAPPGHKANSAP